MLSKGNENEGRKKVVRLLQNKPLAGRYYFHNLSLFSSPLSVLSLSHLPLNLSYLAQWHLALRHSENGLTCDTQHNSIECSNSEGCTFIVMLSVVVLSNSLSYLFSPPFQSLSLGHDTWLNGIQPRDTQKMGLLATLSITA